MKLTPFAYTKLKAFETCPKQGQARYITKEYPFVKTDAMEYGIEVHQLLKDYINDNVPFPPDYAWLEQFVPIRSDDTELFTSELGLGITKDFSPCSFYDADCFFRGYLDVLHIEGDLAVIVDWKTGKPYEDPDELMLHAMLAKAHYPQVKHWRGYYTWLKTKQIGEIHTLSPAVTYRNLIKRVERVESHKEFGDFFANKNPLCPWCDLESCHNYTGRKGK